MRLTIKPIRKPIGSRERESFRLANTKKADQYGLFRPTNRDVQLPNGNWTTIYQFLGYIPQLVNGKAGLTIRGRARNQVTWKELDGIPLPPTLRHKNPEELDAMCDEFMKSCFLPKTMKREKIKKRFLNFHTARIKANEIPSWVEKV